MTASEHDLRAVRLSAGFAVFTAVAHVLDGLVASSLTRLKLCDLVAHLDDNAGTLASIRAVACVILFLSYLVTSTLCTELGHLGQLPVVHHEVDIGEAQAGGVQLDEDLIRLCGTNVGQHLLITCVGGFEAS